MNGYIDTLCPKQGVKIVRFLLLCNVQMRYMKEGDREKEKERDRRKERKKEKERE